MRRRDAVVAAHLAVAIGGTDSSVFTERVPVICVTAAHPDGRSADFMRYDDGRRDYHVYVPNLAKKHHASCRVMEAEAWSEGRDVSLLTRVLGAAVHEVRHRVQHERPNLRFWDALHRPAGAMALALDGARDRALWRIAVSVDAGNWANALSGCEELDAHAVELRAMHSIMQDSEAPPLSEMVLVQP